MAHSHCHRTVVLMLFRRRASCLHGQDFVTGSDHCCQVVEKQEVDVPQAWHNGLVTAIFKKGDEGSCENYRPISLLAVGYKLFASILLRRLRRAGAEDRIWTTQMGFRSNRGTGDAILVARRLIEHAWATHDGSLLLLSLDWAKAFDSVAPGALVKTMQRFGIPTHFCRVVQTVFPIGALTDRCQRLGAKNTAFPKAVRSRLFCSPS